MVDEDLEPLITRCPNCSTQFRVTESQLAAAGGRVRCGACLTVFEGTEHLILDEQTTFSDDLEADAALDALLDELGTAEGSAEQLEEDAENLTQDIPVFFGGFEDEADLAVAPRVDAGVGSDSAPPARTFRAEAVATAQELPIEETFPDAEQDAPAEDEVLAGAGRPAAWEETPLVVDSEPAAGQQPAPEPAQAEAAAGAAAKAPAEASEAAASEAAAAEPSETEASEIPASETRARETDDADYKAWIRPATPDIEQLVDEVVHSGGAQPAEVQPAADEELTAPAPEPAAAEESFGIAAVEKALEQEGFGTAPISFAPEPRRWGVIAVAAVLTLLLAAQIFYLQLPEWSRNPSTRGFYESVCGVFGCELPEIRALESLRTRNLMVRSHPDLEEALVIDAVIVNQAPFPQRFPGLELRFTSVGGLLVAARIFQPEEYLGGELSTDDLMPVNTPVQVSLEIADPGEDAVNYTLSFR
jgi:predicted Zn finger-like uncharacterized protein